MISDLLCAADPVRSARHRLNFDPDPIQARFLASRRPRRLLNCCRQWGKSTTLAVHRFVYGPPGNITLIFAPSLRQSAELLRKMVRFVVNLGFTPRGDGHNERSLMSIHGSRIIALPSSDNRTVGFSAVNLLIFDEAARVDDAVYTAARPMIATTGGDILALSTPRFRRGFFYDAWTHGGDTWERYTVPAADCPRIPAAFLEEERRAESEDEFRRLYCCDFVPVGRTAFLARRPRQRPRRRLRSGVTSMNTPRFFAGLDIGKQHDHSALAVLELRTRQAGFDRVYWVPIIECYLRVRRLTRFPLGTSYRDVVDAVEREMRTPAFGIDTPLVVDATGVGDAIVDLLKGSAIPLVPVILTGGERAAHSGGRLHVPKHQLIDTLCVLLEQGKLAVVRRLPLADAFLRELNDFEARVSVSGRASYGAFRENAHDDLVIAVALAVPLQLPRPRPRPPAAAAVTPSVGIPYRRHT